MGIVFVVLLYINAKPRAYGARFCITFGVCENRNWYIEQKFEEEQKNILKRTGYTIKIIFEVQRRNLPITQFIYANRR